MNVYSKTGRSFCFCRKGKEAENASTRFSKYTRIITVFDSTCVATPIRSSVPRVTEIPLSGISSSRMLQAVVAVSVEALVFIVIGRSCSEGCGFDSHCRPGSFLRFNYRPIMYGAVGSLVLSWSWTRQPGFISFWCLWIQLCNNLVQILCAYNLP